MRKEKNVVLHFFAVTGLVIFVVLGLGSAASSPSG